MGPEHEVLRPQSGADTDRDRLLADVEMQRGGDLALKKQRVTALLEAPDQEHIPVLLQLPGDRMVRYQSLLPPLPGATAAAIEPDPFPHARLHRRLRPGENVRFLVRSEEVMDVYRARPRSDSRLKRLQKALLEDRPDVELGDAAGDGARDAVGRQPRPS